MVTVIHGDNIILSRKKIDDLIDTHSTTKRVNAAKDDLTDIFTFSQTNDLFVEKKTLILENVFSLKGKTLTDIIEIVNNTSSAQLHIILWEGKIIDKRTIEKIKNIKSFLYELPKYYFDFLDSIKPENGAALSNMFKKTLENSTEEQMFYSITKRIRNLMIIKTGRYTEHEETQKMSGWQISKLVTQSKYWPEDRLYYMYKKLFELEFNLKTSNLPMHLSEHIDILLLSL